MDRSNLDGMLKNIDKSRINQKDKNQTIKSSNVFLKELEFAKNRMIANTSMEKKFALNMLKLKDVQEKSVGRDILRVVGITREASVTEEIPVNICMKV